MADRCFFAKGKKGPVGNREKEGDSRKSRAFANYHPRDRRLNSLEKLGGPSTSFLEEEGESRKL